MATSPEYITFVCDSLHGFGIVTKKHMFGEYIVYLNGKPILLVCDNTPFVKILPETASLLGDTPRGYPYEGAKEHFLLDIEDAELLQQLIPVLEQITPLPKPRKNKKGN